MKQSYIQACIELLEAGEDLDTVFDGLKRTLLEKGHQKLYSAVLKGLLRTLLRKKEAYATHLTVANESSLKKLEHEIAVTAVEYGFSRDYAIGIDGSIIGGFVLQNKNKLLDRSYKSSLVRLYRSFS